MATTKIWPVKDSLKRLVDYASNPDKTTDDDLAAVIKYAMNGDKTAGVNEKACYVTGVNCIAETALEEMLSIPLLSVIQTGRSDARAMSQARGRTRTQDVGR